MKIGDTVKMSAKGKEAYRDTSNNPHDLQGELTKPLSSTTKFRYKVKWSNGSTNSYREGELELVTEKLKFYEEIVTRKVTLTRGCITTDLPSGSKFITSGGSECVTIVSKALIKNADIPEIIEHLQQWYDAVQLEKGNDK